MGPYQDRGGRGCWTGCSGVVATVKGLDEIIDFTAGATLLLLPPGAVVGVMVSLRPLLHARRISYTPQLMLGRSRPVLLLS